MAIDWRIKPSPLHYAILKLVVPEKPISGGQFRNRLASRLKVSKSELKHIEADFRTTMPSAFKQHGSIVYPPTRGLNNPNGERHASKGESP